ncbi:hypothetical protein SGPA1_50215 [Streptomyces misionensis JCM 4497]
MVGEVGRGAGHRPGRLRRADSERRRFRDRAAVQGPGLRGPGRRTDLHRAQVHVELLLAQRLVNDEGSR